MAMALALMIGLGLQYGTAPQPANMGGLSSYAAGGDTLPADGSQVRPLLAGTSAEPPLLVINGRYYRMLNAPAAVSADRLGSVIANIQGHSDALELEATAGVLSNIAKPGANVYEVDSLSFKTAVAAEVDGQMRLFQRVGYAANNVIGNEMFEDTLDVVGHVAALELSGVGFIDDEEMANTLVSQLIEFSAFHSSEIPEGEGALTIYLKNDLTLQLMVQGDVYGGCGAWANVEFREAFEAALAAK
jgi:hypothetical protein